MGKYRHARVAKKLRTFPNLLWLNASSLPPSTMEQWEDTHDDGTSDGVFDGVTRPDQRQYENLKP